MSEPSRDLDVNHEWYPKGSLPDDVVTEAPEEITIAGTICDGPHLGLATTRELLEELATRGRVEQRYQATGLELCNTANILIGRLPQSMLRYRTVDS